MDLKVENTITAKVYNELRNSIGWDSKAEELVNEAIKNSAVVKLIKYDNKAVGMARAIGDGLYYLVVDVVVNKEYQGKEIGKKLIYEIVKEIEDRMKDGQKVSINLMSMQGKEEFYEKCGFKKVPFDYTGFGMIRRIQK